MKAVIQIVDEAKVIVSDQTVGHISDGMMILLGVMEGDTQQDIDVLIEKILKMRTFKDDSGKHFELSITEIEGQILVVSQFTLAGSFKKGRRPAFTDAMNPTDAKAMYEKFVEDLKAQGIKVDTGEFGAYMEVCLNNTGPITYIFDSKDI